ncbi:MAG TPA: hypothetical protein VMD29_11655 [Terracidiphilus sp.]|nr:hypothetical protein [Terracidiphilus sp.]
MAVIQSLAQFTTGDDTPRRDLGIRHSESEYMKESHRATNIVPAAQRLRERISQTNAVTIPAIARKYPRPSKAMSVMGLFQSSREFATAHNAAIQENEVHISANQADIRALSRFRHERKATQRSASGMDGSARPSFSSKRLCISFLLSLSDFQHSIHIVVVPIVANSELSACLTASRRPYRAATGFHT